MISSDDKSASSQGLSRTSQNIIMENRAKMMITGVISVDNFDEGSVMLETQLGSLTVKGSGIRVDKLNVDTGELNITGSIVGLVYSDDAKRGSFLSRIFK